jgi:hypothetical protein
MARVEGSPEIEGFRSPAAVCGSDVDDEVVLVVLGDGAVVYEIRRVVLSTGA